MCLVSGKIKSMCSKLRYVLNPDCMRKSLFKGTLSRKGPRSLPLNVTNNYGKRINSSVLSKSMVLVSCDYLIFFVQKDLGFLCHILLLELCPSHPFASTITKAMGHHVFLKEKITLLHVTKDYNCDV